jgi:hypothetical protein
VLFARYDRQECLSHGLCGENERQERDCGGGDEGATVDSPRFDSELLDEMFVMERLFARVHVALSARGQRKAGLLARLDQAQTGYPDRKENDGSRPARCLHDNQNESEADADGQSYESKNASFAPLARANVNRFIHTGDG